MSGAYGPMLLALVRESGCKGRRGLGLGGGAIPVGECSGCKGGNLVRERERAFSAMAYTRGSKGLGGTEAFAVLSPDDCGIKRIS